MRMKKLFILAVAATALVACSRTFDTQKVAPQEIGFGTWTEHLTKAEARVQGTNDFLAGDTFAVYGYKETTSPAAKVTVFDDDVVTASGSGTLSWDYDNHRYWDTNYDQYVFFGVSPSSFGTGGTVTPQTGAISTDVTFAGKDSDILIANKTVVEKGTAPYFNNFGKVEMVFNHAASLVDIIVKKSPALEDATVEVTEFELQKILSSGTLSVSEYAASTPFTPTIAIANWTSPSTPATYDYEDCVGTVTLPLTVALDADFPGATASDEPNASANSKVIDNLVVMPQTFDTDKDADSQQIVLTYTITTTDAANNTSTNTYEDKVLYLCDFDNIDDEDQGGDTSIASWQPGKHYIFFITIDAHEITFSASINNWDPTVINGYNYLVN